MNKTLFIVQFELLAKAQAAMLKRCLAREPDRGNQYSSRLLKSIRGYRTLLEASGKSAGPRAQLLPPEWAKLQQLLETRQQLAAAAKVLNKHRERAGDAVYVWIEEQLRQREHATESMIFELRRKISRQRKQPKIPTIELGSLTDTSLWRQQANRFQRLRRQMHQAITQFAHRKHASAVRPLRDLMRAYRDHLTWSSRVFEIPWPCDPRLISDCLDRLKRIDRWQCLDELLAELEPQTTRMPVKMFEEWQTFRALVKEKYERRLKKTRKALAKDGVEWAGLKLAMDRR